MSDYYEIGKPIAVEGERDVPASELRRAFEEMGLV
jgi:hypothetical protein